MKNKILWVVIVVVAAAGLGFAIAGRKKPEDKYRTAVVDQGKITQTVTATGALSAVKTVQVGSQVSGIISKLYVDFNSQVKKGDLLAELDPTPFQEKIAQTQAALEKARVDMRNGEIGLRRQTALKQQGLAPTADFDQAQATYDAAKASVAQAQAVLNQAQTDLRNSKILAPIDGVVVARQYDVGQTVAASFQAPTLFTIAQDLTKMQVSADVSESDIGQIKLGEPVRFTVDAYPDRQFRGNVAQVRLNATVNQNVVTYPVIVDVPNEDLLLKPTMTANVTIDVATVPNVLRVPNAALRFRPEEKAGAAPAAAAAVGTTPTPVSLEERAARSADRSQPGGGTGAMARQFGQAGGGGRGGPGGRMTRAARPSTVWIPPADPKGDPKMVEVRTGITDGRYTQIVSGEIKAGDKVIVGLATAKAATGASPMGGPGGGRRGF
ncbi:MAG TPA: efflux RND transporter periplasmic adaptor subunit [Thermoanaerobaculia bacterium]|nr:efflux RND transporter periplasmic adaptor subunit [Thermoanaerobaculia bacterium]